jgi:hypothetical protein
MRAFQVFVVATVIAPSIAVAQVGPNPAANGSLDPTVGRGTDSATAPDDAAIGSSTRDGTVADPLPAPETTNDSAAAADSTKTTAPMSTPAARAKKGTAPTDESARKPR